MINPRDIGERVYVVVWPEHMIVKAGYTAQTRWRSFMNRGAVVHQLTAFENWRHAFDYERELHDYFSDRAPFAFASRADSLWLLGSLGGNRETYRIDDWSILRSIPQPSEQVIPGPFRSYLTATPLEFDDNGNPTRHRCDHRRRTA